MVKSLKDSFPIFVQRHVQGEVTLVTIDYNSRYMRINQQISKAWMVNKDTEGDYQFLEEVFVEESLCRNERGKFCDTYLVCRTQDKNLSHEELHS